MERSDDESIASPTDNWILRASAQNDGRAGLRLFITAQKT